MPFTKPARRTYDPARNMQWRQTSIVRRGGLVEVLIPELAEGQAVDVVVRPANHEPPEPPAAGAVRGVVQTTQNADLQLDEFEKHRS
ncbi:MAG TPA: hypothetical protein VH370_19440 [Humisphaera sp.]|nr:hypothetical protein [Humisphaera sp.]